MLIEEVLLYHLPCYSTEKAEAQTDTTTTPKFLIATPIHKELNLNMGMDYLRASGLNFFADSPVFAHQQISVGVVKGLSIVCEAIPQFSTNRSNAFKLGGGREFTNAAESRIWPKGQKFVWN